MTKLDTNSHIHNHFSHDAKGTVLGYCEAAKNLKYIAFTNHVEKFSEKENRYTLNHQKYKQAYRSELTEIEAARLLYPELDICIGVELENCWEFLDEMKLLIRELDFDVLLGSVHTVDNVCISSSDARTFYPTQPANHVYQQYFKEMLMLIEKLDFDVLAHFDVLKRHAIQFYGPFPYLAYENTIKEILFLMKEKSIALEVNTSGLHQEPKETYPGPGILKWAFEMGLDLTIGTDAHSPKAVNKGITEAKLMLKNIGFKRIVYFKKRQKYYADMI